MLRGCPGNGAADGAASCAKQKDCLGQQHATQFESHQKTLKGIGALGRRKPGPAELEHDITYGPKACASRCN